MIDQVEFAGRGVQEVLWEEGLGGRWGGATLQETENKIEKSKHNLKHIYVYL